jgi:hypothetical protein
MPNFTFDDNSVLINDFEALSTFQKFYGIIIASDILEEMSEIEKIIKTKRASNINIHNEDFLEHESYEFLLEKLKFEDFDLDKMSSVFPNKNIEFYSKGKLMNSFNIENN